MRTVMILILAICSVTLAGYDYTITDGYFGTISLKNMETFLMTGGGGII